MDPRRFIGFHWILGSNGIQRDLLFPPCNFFSSSLLNAFEVMEKACSLQQEYDADNCSTALSSIMTVLTSMLITRDAEHIQSILKRTIPR